MDHYFTKFINQKKKEQKRAKTFLCVWLVLSLIGGSVISTMVCGVGFVSGINSIVVLITWLIYSVVAALGCGFVLAFPSMFLYIITTLLFSGRTTNKLYQDTYYEREKVLRARVGILKPNMHRSQVLKIMEQDLILDFRKSHTSKKNIIEYTVPNLCNGNTKEGVKAKIHFRNNLLLDVKLYDYSVTTTTHYY